MADCAPVFCLNFMRTTGRASLGDDLEYLDFGRGEALPVLYGDESSVGSLISCSAR